MHQFHLPLERTVSVSRHCLLCNISVYRSCLLIGCERGTLTFCTAPSECPVFPLVPSMYSVACYLFMPRYHCVTAGKGYRTRS